MTDSMEDYYLEDYYPNTQTKPLTAAELNALVVMVESYVADGWPRVVELIPNAITELRDLRKRDKQAQVALRRNHLLQEQNTSLVAALKTIRNAPGMWTYICAIADDALASVRGDA